jgi:hypothetical protein
MQIENAQNEAYEANAKAVALADAKRGVFDQERRINDTKGRILDFSGFEKKDDDKSLPSCEPDFLYYLDPVSKLPQLNDTGIDALAESMSMDTTMGYLNEDGKV